LIKRRWDLMRAHVWQATLADSRMHFHWPSSTLNWLKFW
jgi:hypothetical protein